jgi:hypothetical protein
MPPLVNCCVALLALMQADEPSLKAQFEQAARVDVDFPPHRRKFSIEKGEAIKGVAAFLERHRIFELAESMLRKHRAGEFPKRGRVPDSWSATVAGTTLTALGILSIDDWSVTAFDGDGKLVFNLGGARSGATVAIAHVATGRLDPTSDVLWPSLRVPASTWNAWVRHFAALAPGEGEGEGQEKRVRLDLKKAALRDVLAKLQELYGVRFTYPDGVVPKELTVDCEFLLPVTLREILEDVGRQARLKSWIQGDTIELRPDQDARRIDELEAGLEAKRKKAVAQTVELLRELGVKGVEKGDVEGKLNLENVVFAGRIGECACVPREGGSVVDVFVTATVSKVIRNRKQRDTVPLAAGKETTVHYVASKTSAAMLEKLARAATGVEFVFAGRAIDHKTRGLVVNLGSGDVAWPAWLAPSAAAVFADELAIEELRSGK